MVPGTAIKKIMRDERVNQTSLASMAGLNGQSKISESLKRDMRVSTLIRLANAMGYKVYLRKNTAFEFVAKKTEIELTNADEVVTGDS